MTERAVRSIDGTALLALAAEVVGRGGTLETRVHGGSMAPVLADGDRVVLGPWRRRVGALVLAELAGRPLLHRVVRIDGDRVLLEADACQRQDWVACQQLRGEVVAIRRTRPRWLARLEHRARRWLRGQRRGEVEAGSPSRL